MTSAVSNSACPEKQFLAYCAHSQLNPLLTEKIARLLERDLDWDYILNEAEENSITPLVSRQLHATATDRLPASAADRLKNACRANTIRCLFLSAELIKILDLFRSHGIHAIPYKGPVLAVQAYDDVTLREFEDLDVVLRQSDLPKAHEVMLGLGYRPKYDWILSPDAARSTVPGEYNYRDEERRVMVELHTELTLRHFPKPPDLDELSQRLVAVKLNEREIQTFSVEDGLAILCIHGAKDFWERFSWIADISELVTRYPNLNWDITVQRAKALNAERMLHVGLALAAGLLDTPVSSEIRRRVQADQVATGVALEIANRLMSLNYRSLDAPGRFNFRRRMVPGTFEGCRYAMRLSVVPAEEDWQMMRLPGPLAPLYIALRPLRLLRKYGWASRRA
ncbi:MAG TPA: nucleotidyltransferase family protein [Candidatus Acidoferrales bacterium]|nr:nucleotidyltransferase family protein [Candidatus Acidoferrales bacterium]